MRRLYYTVVKFVINGETYFYNSPTECHYADPSEVPVAYNFYCFETFVHLLITKAVPAKFTYKKHHCKLTGRDNVTLLLETDLAKLFYKNYAAKKFEGTIEVSCNYLPTDCLCRSFLKDNLPYIEYLHYIAWLRSLGYTRCSV